MRKEQTKKLRAERRNLEHIIAGISHDFRTPLTSAMGYLQMIDRSSELNETNSEFLEIAMSKAGYLRALSEEFFELSRMSASEEENEIIKLNLVNILSEYILAQYGWINEKGIRMEVDIPENDIFIMGNERYLKRIFENLFSNCAKYAENYIRIRLKRRMESWFFR